ncbi:MAG: RNA-binding transcriptional accessory protein, partial [Lawsonibacter sp.]|nr:RNA-binding transcriptional accessory protein [Lawsonibacter sp.]
MNTMIQTLAQELGCTQEHVSNVVELLDSGATIPFIARYRKELHGSMDDQLLRQLADRLQYLRNLEQRRGEVKTSIENQGKLTEELAAALDAAATLAEVEDLYRPYKPKRRTRATIAREKGLAPLAALLSAKGPAVVPEQAAAGFVDSEKGVETVQDALQGASDILAEELSDDAAIRKELRELYLRRAVLASRAADKEPEDSVYRLYYDFKCPVNRLQGYQVLAINRGEREEVLKVSVELDAETAHVTVRRACVPGAAAMEFVRSAADDAYDRLIQPSMEREIRGYLTDQANEGAIHMFALNLKPLLMQPPVKGKVTMGLDPGYRMGCKVAVVDGTGKVLDTTVVYPTHGDRKKAECISTLAALIQKHSVEHIAIGNGTASRETEQMTVELIHKTGGGVSYMIVSEAGASVYSASKLAAEEFPQFDVNLRSAVSIARRLQDPLAELVKIDPKAIGVGQYQHDMPQVRLGETLDG